MGGEQTPKSESLVGHKLQFHFIKSNAFRVVHVDGVWGGITPQLNIQMALFNERRPIPQSIVQEIQPDLSITEITSERVERLGLVREVEIEAVLSVETARSLITWL